MTATGSSEGWQLSCGARIRCLCGALVEVAMDERIPLGTQRPRAVARYQGHCVCGLTYFLSIASTHGHLHA